MIIIIVFQKGRRSLWFIEWKGNMQLGRVVDLVDVSGGSGKDSMFKEKKGSKRKITQRITKQTPSH
jgi:hypothetical protein